jgi:hypothetical protein
VANPFRPVPGAGAPVYVTTAAPPPAVRVVPPPSLRPMAHTPVIAYTPPPGTAPPAAPVPPPAWRPTAAAPTPPPAVVPAPPEPRWHPAPPVARGQEPADAADARLARDIRAACEGLVTNVTVERAGPTRLVVTFAATTETLAEIAARAVSAIPELRPLAVEFKVKILATAR